MAQWLMCGAFLFVYRPCAVLLDVLKYTAVVELHVGRVRELHLGR
jgi:hypothetical protein